MRTQFKIALFVILTNTSLLLLFGGSLYYFLQNYSYTDFYKRLETRARITARYTFDSNNVNSEYFKAIRREHLEVLTDETEYLYEVKSEAGLKDIVHASQLPPDFVSNIYKNGKSTWHVRDILYAGIRYNAN